MSSLIAFSPKSVDSTLKEFLSDFLFGIQIKTQIITTECLLDPSRLEFQQLEWIGDSILNIFISANIFL